jgi:transposase
MQADIRDLDHYGIISGLFKELGLCKVIDDLMPKSRVCNVTHGQTVLAMVINGLGFTERRLYMFPDFFANLPTERLLGDGVLPEHLNEYALGETLDKIYDFGATELFKEIALKVMQLLPLGHEMLHVDTTNFSLYGDFEGAEGGDGTIEITYGHPKDGRWDLKRFVLSLVCNQLGIPLFMKAYSGNASDRNTLVETVKNVQDAMLNGEKVYSVADSALYSKDNINELKKRGYWITRVPATLSTAAEFLKADLELTAHPEDPRYSYCEREVTYGGITQKWVLWHSAEMQAKKEATYAKQLEKDLAKVLKAFQKLQAKDFFCEKDALEAAREFMAAQKLFRFSELEAVPESKRLSKKRGRPTADEAMTTVYRIEAVIELDDAAVRDAASKLGRFILASNDLELAPETMLGYYKKQSNVEQGFRFMKDKSFRVAEVYIKKPERIEALSMIMVLCLMIYSIGEWRIRTRLEETGETVPDQKKKPTQNPTMKWIFHLFRGIREANFTLPDGSVQSGLANMSDMQRRILQLIGPDCEAMYQ